VGRISQSAIPSVFEIGNCQQKISRRCIEQ
jgi:hypothetical protein